MNISTIEIVNIKGIENKTFFLDIVPNKPNILVAPNGFGKSSFAISFDSLKSNKIELDEKHYFNRDETKRPKLSISTTTGLILVADDTQNTISDYFDVFVINNQMEPKATIKKFNGFTGATPSLEIAPTVLVQTIPQKIDFKYSSAALKTSFGTNANKLLNNISSLFSCGPLLYRIEHEIDFSRFELKGHTNIIDASLKKINNQTGTGSVIKAWIVTDILPEFQKLQEFTKLSRLLTSFGFKEIADEVDAYLAAWQILKVKSEMGLDYKKACKYVYYLDSKKHFTKTISDFNPVKNRFDIKPKVEGNSLVVKWPKAHEFSNGQRDILTFIAMLLKARGNFRKKDCILIIDEIFDYMDDGNLITFQYYISTFIDEMKRMKKRIFPILLTHLDPLFFNHFCFNDAKIKVKYLKEIQTKSNQHILNLIYKREETSIQNAVDAYYFHFHPVLEGVNLLTEFGALKLNIDWATPKDFFTKIYREVRRYLYEADPFDPLAVCFGVRAQIEKLVYNSIEGAENKRIFLEETNGTKNKLQYAQSIGVQIPETYFLLGIIYNTSLHLSEGQDISKPLGLKLENGTIKQMIWDIFHPK